MPSSLRKLKANRANAKKSTGPKSAAAKEKVSHNSVNHGLCGRFDVLACEHQDDYDLLLNRLHEEEKPVGTAEVELVVKMAQHTWLCRRALRLQEACFSMEPAEPGQTREQQAIGVRTTINNYVRYHAAQDRAYRRASQELLQRRKERQLAERGFASQKRLEAEETRKAEKHAQTMALQKARLMWQKSALPRRWPPCCLPITSTLIRTATVTERILTASPPPCPSEGLHTEPRRLRSVGLLQSQLVVSD